MANKSVKSIFHIFLVLIIIAGCNIGNHKESGDDGSAHIITGQKEIIIYGSKTCPHCVHFMQELEKSSIVFTFKEVDNSDKNFQEMYDKVKMAKIQGYINYPVVDIGGEILIAPEFNEFKKYL